MKKFKITLVILICLIGLIGPIYAQHEGHQMQQPKKETESAKPVYYCPMHPTYTSDKPGDCPICNMKLVKKEAKATEDICVLHNCPMLNKPGGCPMLVSGNIKDCPHCGAHLAQEEGVAVYISAERQQYIGVKKEAVQKTKLIKEIRTVGRVAYDPQLFIAQEEYLQALKVAGIPHARSLVDAARQKLLLLGMSQKEIDELAENAKPQEELYLPIDKDTVWVYMTIYEYEIGLIKEGQAVEVDAVAFPGEIFAGEVRSITPVLDAMTRSINVRAQVKNTENKLRPEMFVNVKLSVDLGEKLAVPESAVMDTGERRFVFIAKPDGYFAARDVKLGQKTEGFYEALEGLSEGEEVVTSGNFFIDSESRLKSAVSSGEGHQHG